MDTTGQNPTTPNTGSGLDPNALAITRAIGLQENGGQTPTSSSYSNKGKSGEFGLYQFRQPTWRNYASQILGDANAPLTPENQNHVTYGMVSRWLGEGYSPTQIFSLWNAGNPDAAAQGIHGVNQYGAKYNTTAYALNANNYYQEQLAKLTGQGTTGTTTPSPTYQNSFEGGLMGTTQKNIWQNITSGNIGTAAGQALNFAFPILGDLGNDIKSGGIGKSGKTWLQQLGDLGLSALWFVPIGGEAEAAARGGELAAQAGGELAARGGAEAATGAAETAGKGIAEQFPRTAKILASPITKGAALGYGGGVAAGLSQGQSLGQAATPNLQNLLGAGLGASLPAAMSALTKGRMALSGISPQLQNILKETDLPSGLLEDYVNAAKQHTEFLRAPTPLTTAADELDKVSAQIAAKDSAAGAEIGKVKQSLNNVPIISPDLTKSGAVAPSIAQSEGTQNLLNEIENRFGITFDSNGKALALRANPTISPADTARLGNVWKQIQSLGPNASMRDLTDVIENINREVNFPTGIQGAPVNKSQDPINGFLKSIAANLNEVARSRSSDLANANDTFSQIKDIRNELAQMAGNQNQRGALLIKRVFSGDKQGEVQDLFGKIKNLTGIDLTQHAAMAYLATQIAGDPTERGLLQQTLQDAIKEGGVSPTSLLYKWITKQAQKRLANPLTIARGISNPQAPGLLQRLLPAAAIKTGTVAAPLISGAVQTSQTPQPMF